MIIKDIVVANVAAPTAVITGETRGSIIYAIDEYIEPAIKEMDIEGITQIMERLNQCIYQKELVTDITISVNEKEEVVKDSLAAVERAFSILKVKVGKAPLGDIERVRGDPWKSWAKITLRVDANQGWTAKQAVRLIGTPVHYSDVAGMQYVTKHTLTDILADESVFSPKDALIIIEKRAEFIKRRKSTK